MTETPDKWSVFTDQDQHVDLASLPGRDPGSRPSHSTQGSTMSSETIPPDFDGPICVNCRHVQRGYDGPSSYRCRAFEPARYRPAERSTITGELYPEWTVLEKCVDKNRDGKCDRFERADAAIAVSLPSDVEERPSEQDEPEVSAVSVRHRSILRRLAAMVGAWLVRWAER